MRIPIFFVLIAIALTSAASIAAEPDANRLTYLDEFSDSYYPSLSFAKLVTPQWVGDEGVEAVVTLGIDDMRGVDRYESYLRPILDRLKKIDGRAPVSIMTNQIDPNEPHLQRWLKEGLSIETHTADHPCPCLAGGDFAKAKSTYDRCVDQISKIPGNRPVAFRFPCMDSRNTPSPRAYAEIFNKTTSNGNFVQISTSVCVLLNADDPALPRELVIDPDGRSRFAKYVPFPSFVNKVKNYPYPFVIGRLCWEFAVAVPDDWQGQNLHASGNPQTTEDIKAVIDATTLKAGTANITFHPANWIRNQQVVSIIDHVHKKHGKKVKFLNFRECLERLNKNLLAGQPLRAANGQDNGVRLLDINGDGYLDVCIANEHMQKTRIWLPKEKRWKETTFPTPLVRVDNGGKRTDAGVRFGIVGDGDKVSIIVRNEDVTGAWTFAEGQWKANSSLTRGLETGGKPVFTSHGGQDTGVRLRDIDGDGRCELIVGNDSQRAVFAWAAKKRQWNRLPFDLPGQATIVDSQGRDAGLRFVDIDEDGHADVIYSNQAIYSLHLFESIAKGWSRHKRSGKRTDAKAIPMITRAGTNNGAWFAKGHMWLQNEDTNRLPDGVDRRSFADLLDDRNPPPKDAKTSLRSIRMRDGFRVELVAAEPLVMDPVGFDWDSHGRLWVVEMADYPLGLDDRGKPGGRVRFLEDTNGDGKYDSSTLFMDNIPFPNAVMAWGKGVLVSAAPDIFYAEDTDGDGRADKKEVLYSGFAPGNQQHRANGFAWGLDNWIHVANGDSGGRVKSIKTGKTIDLGTRDLRIRPHDGSVESTTGMTQYGRSRDDYGNWFGTSNSIPITHFVLDDHYLSRNPHFSPPTPRVRLATTQNTGIFAISRVLSHWEGYKPPARGEPHRFTSACSTIIYRDNLFGSAFANNTFTSEPVHNLVHRRVLQPDGASFTSSRAAGRAHDEFLASSDSWFRPTSLRIGPDGALWVADMYRLIIEHPEWIDDREEKRLELRAGHDRGRIYRIVPIGAERRPIPTLGKLRTEELVNSLNSPNGWQRDRVQQLLIERNDPKATPLLTKMATSDKKPLARLHALCTLDGLDSLTPDVLSKTLADTHPGVRRHAARLTGEQKEISDRMGKGLLKLAGDSDIHVRLACAYALGEWNDRRAAASLAQIALNDNDRFVNAAVMSSINANNVSGVLSVVLAESSDNANPQLAESLLGMATALGDDDGLLDVLAIISAGANGQQRALWQFSALARVMDRLDARKTSLDQLRRKANKPQQKTLRRIEKMIQQARDEVVSDETPLARRVMFVGLLARKTNQHDQDLQRLGKLLTPQNDLQLQLAVVDRLGRSGDRQVPKLLVAGFKSHGIQLRRAVLAALLSRSEWQSRLLDFVADGIISPADLQIAQRVQLLNHKDTAIKTRAAKILSTSVDPNRAKVLASHQDILKLHGDRVRGIEVFKKKCATCHRVDGVGIAVGPDLRALTNRAPAVLLIALLDPSRAVEDKFRSYQALTEDGQQFIGVLASETGGSITLLDAEGKRHDLLRSELDELQNTGKSLMPEGLEKDLSRQQIADVIAYVGELGPPPKTFPNQKPQIVRAGDDGALTLASASAQIYGPTLVFEQKYRNLGFWSSATDYASWTIEVPKTGRYQIRLDYAVAAAAAGDAMEIRSGSSTISTKVESTGSWDTYQQKQIGHLTLEAGSQTVTVRSLGKPKNAMIDLRTLVLTPEPIKK